MDAVFELVVHEVKDLDKSVTQFYQERLTTPHMTKLEREGGGGGEPGQMYCVGAILSRNVCGCKAMKWTTLHVPAKLLTF